MKKLLPLLAAIWLCVNCTAQPARPPISSSAQVYAIPTSYYGWKPTLLPGSIRTIPVGNWCANISVTQAQSSGSGTVLQGSNNLSIGDRVFPLGFTSGPMGFAVGPAFTVTAANSTQFTIDKTDGDTSIYMTPGATVRKTAGAGCTGKVKWEIIDTGTTAETYKLQSIDGATDTGFVSHPVITSTAAVVRLQVGPTEGVTSFTGSKGAGTLTQHSTVSFTLRATSVDNPSSVVDMPMLVTANGGGYPGVEAKAFCNPGFRTVYTGRHIPIACQVFGNVNQMVNTTIESAPGGGDATLSFATFPQPDFFSGTVTGLYRLKLCPAADGSANACAHVSIWVDSSSPPAGNADIVEQTPCPTGAGPTVMGITWANVIDIGPSQPFHDFLTAIPQTWTGPMLVRYHNEGTVGHPTTVHNQVQINPPVGGGPFADNKPSFFMCGIPNMTSGELPVNDANNSTANPWASEYIVGPYSFFGFAGPTGGNPLPDINPLPWSYITTQNVKFINATLGNYYTSVKDGTIQQWGEASGPRPSNAIQNFNLIGNRIDWVSDGIFDDCNAANAGMNHCTLDTYDEGNHLSNYGYPSDYLAHPEYRQAFRVYSMFDLFDGAISGSQGTLWFSDRGTRSFHMYSRLVVTDPSQQAGQLAGHSEVQDAYNILNLDEFIGYQGSASCGTVNSISLNCLGGWTLDPTAWQAAVVEEHNRTDYQIGNALSQPNVNKSIGAAMTHSWYSWQPYGTGGYDGHEWFPENLTQNLWFAYNTVQFGSASVNAGAEQLFEDTRVNFSDPYESLAYGLTPPYYPEIWMVNNIVPMNAQSPACSYGCNTLNVNPHQITHFQTNMLGTLMTPAGAFNSSINSFNTNGYSLYPQPADWGNIDPITDHLSGWTTPNFLTYSAYPIQPASMAPLNSSDAVGAATTLVGDIAAYPPRYNAAQPDMIFHLRTQPTTLGAYDSNGGPSPVSIAFTPNPLNVISSSSGAGVCTTTLSDFSTRNCVSPVCVSTNTASLNISGVNWTSTGTGGSGNINCTAESLTAPSVPFTVTVVTAVSISVKPNPLSATATVSGNLVCTTLLSNSTTRPCASPSCTSTNTGAMTISGLHWSAVGTGSGNLNCTAESLTAPADPFTVTGTGALPMISGNITLSGNMSIKGTSGTGGGGTITYVNTTFNEASPGTNLAGTTPATCSNGCIGPWTLASGTDFTYQSGGGVAVGVQSALGDIIDSGTADGVVRARLSTCTGTGYAPCIFVVRYTDSNNYIFIAAYNSGAGSPFTQIYDVVGGGTVKIGVDLTGPVIDDYVITLTGSTISVANSNGSIGGFTSNTTGTKVGFALAGNTMKVDSFSVKSN